MGWSHQPWASARQTLLLRPDRDEVLEKLEGGRRRAADHKSGDQTLGVYAESWLEGLSVHNLKPATLASYRITVRTHIVPGLGN